jgi:PhzF family phenazine biosynthesis protein
VTDPQVERWTAFSADPAGGNPAGVILEADGWDDERMRAVAAALGYAESAFVATAPASGGPRGIRYFSPVAEVPFCGHATVAAAAALAAREGDGRFAFATPVGPVEITVETGAEGPTVSFTSVEPRTDPLPPAALSTLLTLIGLGEEALDPRHPPALAFAGNVHPLLVLRSRGDFDSFTFDPRAARELLDAEGWPATIIVLWREDDARWHARNIFPVGTLDEDPATGAAAAATGGYLRATGAVAAPARIDIAQGSHVGRPSRLVVDIPAVGGIVVRGMAVRLPHA